MLTDLLPCPFCGGKAYMVQHGTPRQSCIIECGNCGTRHDSGDEGARCGSSWNRRAAHSVGAQTGSGSLAFDYGNALVDRKLDPSYNAWAQEPVAWMRSYRQFSDTQSAAPDPGYMVTSFHKNAEFAAKYPGENVPLYTHPQPMTLGGSHESAGTTPVGTPTTLVMTDAARDAEDAKRWRYIEKKLHLGPPVGPRGAPKTRHIIANLDLGYGSEIAQTVADVIDAEIERLDRAKGK